MNDGFGKDFCRKGNSGQRSGPLSELPDSETRILPRSSPSQVAAPTAQWPHIARYCGTIVAMPQLARYFFREGSTHPKWCDTAFGCLVSRRHICAVPRFATYAACYAVVNLQCVVNLLSHALSEAVPQGKRRLDSRQGKRRLDGTVHWKNAISRCPGLRCSGLGLPQLDFPK